jgi:hypothetical protein
MNARQSIAALPAFGCIATRDASSTHETHISHTLSGPPAFSLHPQSPTLLPVPQCWALYVFCSSFLLRHSSLSLDRLMGQLRCAHGVAGT